MGTPLKNEHFQSSTSPPKFATLPAHSILKESTKDNLTHLQTPPNKQLSVHFENNTAPVSSIYKASCEEAVLSERSPAMKQRLDSGSMDDLMGIMGQLQLNSAKKNVKKLNSDVSCKENSAIDTIVTETQNSTNVKSNNQAPAPSCDDSEHDTNSKNGDTDAETVSYKLDFEHLENMDPFQTKSAVVNSPPSQRIEKAVDNEPVYDEDDDDVVSFKSKAEKSNDERQWNSDKMDTFETKSSIVSPPLQAFETIEKSNAFGLDNQNIDPFKASTTVLNLPESCEVEETDNYCKFENDNTENIDPFKTKSEVLNSPIPYKTDNLENEMKFDDDNIENIDPFKTKSTVSNSPMLEKTEKVDNEIEFFDENIANIDPFKTKSAVLNSPIIEKTEKVENEIKFDDENIENIDLFKTKSAVLNSPILEKTEKVENEIKFDDDIENIDPFKTKAAVLNSPTIGKTEKVENEIKFNDENHENTDPIKTDFTVTNSQVLPKVEDIDDKQYDFSTTENIDPFQTKSVVANSPDNKQTIDQNENMDPFEIKSTVVTLPAAHKVEELKKLDNENTENVDPSKTKSIANSSSVQRTPEAQNDSIPGFENMKTDEIMSEFVINKLPRQADKHTFKYNLDNLNTIDPFKTTSSVLNSPEQSENKTDKNSNYIDEKKQESIHTSVDDNIIDSHESNFSAEISPSPQPDGTIASGRYNLDLENLDTLDPFKTKSGLLNSPSSKSDLLIQNVSPSKKCNVNEDFKSVPSNVSSAEQAKNVNNTKIPNHSGSTCSLDLDCLDNIDPFNIKSSLKNSPGKSDDVNHELKSVEKCDVKTKPDKHDNQEEKGNNDAVIASVSCYIMDFDNLDNINPFASKSTMVNSPQPKKITDSSSSSTAKNLKHAENVQAETSNSTENSFGDLNNTVIECKPDPESSENDSNITGLDGSGISDEQFDIVDPFQSQSESSLDKEMKKASVVEEKEDVSIDTIEKLSTKELNDISDIDLSEDPFKSANTIPNSPPPQKSLSSQQPISPHNESHGELLDEVHPFKPKIHIQNSSQSKNVANEKCKPECQLQGSDAMSSTVNMISMNGGGLDAFVAQSNVLQSRLEDIKDLASLPIDTGINKLQEPFSLMDSGNFVCTTRKNAAETVEVEESEEEFKPASEVFNDPSAWDMLEQFGSGGEESKQSALARMSLYVKFDPLVNAVCPSKTPENRKERKLEVINPNNTLDMSKSVIEESLLLMGTPPKKKHNLRRKPTEPKLPAPLESDEFEKPTIDLIFDEIPTSAGNSEGDVESQEFNNIPSQMSVEDEFGEENIVQVLKYSESDWKKLKVHLGMELQGRLLNKENSWNKKFVTQCKETEKIKEEYEKIKKEISTMSMVIAEYEKLISELIAKNQKCSSDSSDTVENLKKERDQALQDVQAVENTFADLHRRYEKMKGVLESYRKNEAVLTKSAQDSLENLKKNEINFQNFKKQSEATIQKQLKEIEKMKASHQTELLRIETLSKKKDLQIQSSQKLLEQKEQEVKELTDLSDQLLASLEGKG